MQKAGAGDLESQEGASLTQTSPLTSDPLLLLRTGVATYVMCRFKSTTKKPYGLMSYLFLKGTSIGL